MKGLYLIIFSQYFCLYLGNRFNYLIQTRGKNGKTKRYLVGLNNLWRRNKLKYPVETGQGYHHDSVDTTLQEHGDDYQDLPVESEQEQDPREILINMAMKRLNKTGHDYEATGPDQSGDAYKIAGSVLVSAVLKNEPLHILKTFVGGEKFNFCKPPSLISWQKRKGIKQDLRPGQKFRCYFNLTEKLQVGSKPIDWDEWDKKVFSNETNFKSFPRGEMPVTQDKKFKEAVNKLAKILLEVKILRKYLSILAFLKEHPDMNEVLLRYTSVAVDLQSSSTARILVSPMEIDHQTYFPSPDKKTGHDYENTGILHMDDSKNYTVDPAVSYTKDKAESVWDYYREDPLFHVFHTLLHQSFEYTYPRSRNIERFFYTHDQMIRRGEIERSLLGLPPLVPLGPNDMIKPMGPGFDVGYWAWSALTPRPDNCVGDKARAERLMNTGNSLKTQRFQTYPEFMSRFRESSYHEEGHLVVGYCSNSNNVMAFSEVSPRDPIFWRWHMHVSNYIRDTTNKILPGYTRRDIALSGGVTVEEVFTTGTGLNKNSLQTYFEEITLKIADKSSISYRRLNHKDFTFNIKISNPQGSKKKVIVRLFLGISKAGSFDQKGVIELERFVTMLSGESSQIIKKKSIDSHQTMKSSGMNMNRMSDLVLQNLRRQDGRLTETFCGFPHNMYLPRSKEGPEGQDFELLAFVNDVAQDVTEGNDDIEHMMCGHKSESAVWDDRLHGFPFDRNIAFNLNSLKQKVFTQTTVNIVHGDDIGPNTDSNEQEEKILEELKKINAKNKDQGHSTRTSTTVKATTTQYQKPVGSTDNSKGTVTVVTVATKTKGKHGDKQKHTHIGAPKKYVIPKRTGPKRYSRRRH